MRTIEELENAYAEACIAMVRADAALRVACPRMSACRMTPEQEAAKARIGVAFEVSCATHLDLHESYTAELLRPQHESCEDTLPRSKEG